MDRFSRQNSGPSSQPLNRKVPGPTGPAVHVDEVYALALRGRGAAALRLLDDAVDAGGAEPVWPEAYRLARIRILLSLPDPGQQRKGRDLLWQAGETGSWQALLEQARQEHREGEGQAAAATLRRCLRSFGAGSRGEDAEVPALSALLEREAEKITHPVPTAGGADDPGTLSPDLLLRDHVRKGSCRGDRATRGVAPCSP